MTVSTASLLASYIRASAVPRIFAYPGDPIIEFLEQSRLQEIEVVLARREGTAAFMAEATALVSGRLGVCASTLGPGSTALVNGVAAANLDRAAVLAISGQIDSNRETFFTHQVVDHRSLFTPITKWAGHLQAGSANTTIRKAIRTAVAERPGAVHLSCGEDTFKMPVGDEMVSPPPLGSLRGGFSIVTGEGPDPTELLRQSRRPVLLAGIGAVRCEASTQLARLAETAGIPVVAAPMAKGVINEESPMFAGTLDMASPEVVWGLLRSADLVIAAGFDPVELVKPWSVSSAVLHIDTVANTDQIYASSCEIVGDIAAVLEWLTSEWSGEPRWSEDDVAAHRNLLSSSYYSGRVAGKLNPTDVIDVVYAWADDDAIVSCDVGSHKMLVGQGWKATQPRSTLMSNGLSAMGFGVPAAIAAQLANPGRQTIALVGDGGFAMVATEMRLASSLGLPLTVVVFVDGSLNRIELKQMAVGYPSVATRIEDTDLVRLAEAMGCNGVRVTSPSALESALDTHTDRSRPLVIEARIDPAQYEAQF